MNNDKSTLALGPDQSTSLLALSRLNVFALRESSPKVSQEVGALLDVLVAKNGGNGPGSLLAVVEGDATRSQLATYSNQVYLSGKSLREHVVNNVVLNNAVEDVAADPAKLTIDSRHSALDERPVLGLVVSGILMRVVQVGDSD